jgi:hypothetical protein
VQYHFLKWCLEVLLTGSDLCFKISYRPPRARLFLGVLLRTLLAFECIHSIQIGSTIRRNFCAYKLDMAKAYFDWRFLEGVLVKVGFRSQCIRWVMSCVTTIPYSIRFNGQMLDSFTPSRGIRQCDPLSLYLFYLLLMAYLV